MRDFSLGLGDMMLCMDEENITSSLKRAKKVKDYDDEVVLMQIGLLYYPEWHHFPRRVFFPNLSRLYFPSCYPPLCL